LKIFVGLPDAITSAFRVILAALNNLELILAINPSHHLQFFTAPDNPTNDRVWIDSESY